jgi:transposase-like protein
MLTYLRLSISSPDYAKGATFPHFLEPRRTAEKALTAVIHEAYVHGVSTRSDAGRGHSNFTVRGTFLLWG